MAISEQSMDAKIRMGPHVSYYIFIYCIGSPSKERLNMMQWCDTLRTDEQLDLPVPTTSVTPNTPFSTDCGMQNEINGQAIMKHIKLVAARPDLHCKHMYLAETIDIVL
jgi:hypothetical protein